MTQFWLRLYIFVVFAYVCAWCALGVKEISSKPPSAGWCRSKHRPKKAAQSGFDGYCKACYREKHPRKYAAKSAGRKKMCVSCSEVCEIGRANLCRPCLRARSCDSCDAVSLRKSAAACGNCHTLHESLGATRSRLDILSYVLLCYVVLSCTIIHYSISSNNEICYKKN